MKRLKTNSTGQVAAPRFRGVVAAPAPRTFGGVVAAGFGDWIAARWQLAPSRPPARARQSFLNRKTPPPTRPSLRADRAYSRATYNLFATLRLALSFSPRASAARVGTSHIPNVFAPTPLFFTHAYASGGGDAGRRTHASGATLRLLGERVREAASVTAARTFSFQLGGSTHGPRTPSAARLALPLRLRGAGLGWTQLFNEKLLPARPRRNGAHDFALAPARRGATVISLVQLARDGGAARSPNEAQLRDVMSASLSRLALRGGATRGTLLMPPRAGSSAFAVVRRPLVLLTQPPGKGEEASRRVSHTTLRLTFAAPRRDDATAGPLHLSPFGPPPPLQFARPAAPSAGHEVAEALRELQKAVGAMRPSAAAPAPQQVEQLTRQVMGQLERQLRIEKERRGL